MKHAGHGVTATYTLRVREISGCKSQCPDKINMRFNLKIQGNVQNTMRQLGYYFEREDKGEMAFSRPLSLSGSGYPKFHIYLDVSRETSDATVNLHLDHKKPSYGGTKAHSGESEGELVEKEAERIRQALLGP